LERRQFQVLVAITAAGAVARFATLDLQSFQHDEAVTAGRILHPGLLHTLDAVAQSERSPPLYYTLAWAWSQVFGLGEMGLRSLSAIVGSLTIPAAWYAGRELASSRAGLIGASLVAFNPLLIWYSQEARSYVLLVLFSTLALAYFARAARHPSPRPLALWAVASVLALSSHYFAAFMVAPQLVWLLVRAPVSTRRQTMAAGGAVVAIGLALLPLAQAQQGEGRRDPFLDQALSRRTLEVAVDTFAGEQPEPFVAERRVDLVQGGALAVGAASLLAAATLTLVAGTRRERLGMAMAGGTAAAAVLGPVALALASVDLVVPRNMLGGCVPLMLVLGIGLGLERRRRVGLVIATAALGTLALVGVAAATTDRMQRLDWRSAAAAAGSSDTPRIVVVNKLGDDPIKWYLGARDLRGPARVTEVVVISISAEITPPPRFRLVQTRRASRFLIRRFQAPRRVRVRRSDYAARRLLHERSDVLIDRPELPGGGG